MEKRNFVTPMRTVDSSGDLDSVIKTASFGFSGNDSGEKSSYYEKKASIEDCRTDSEDRSV